MLFWCKCPFSLLYHFICISKLFFLSNFWIDLYENDLWRKLRHLIWTRENGWVYSQTVLYCPLHHHFWRMITRLDCCILKNNRSLLYQRAKLNRTSMPTYTSYQQICPSSNHLWQNLQFHSLEIHQKMS